VSNDTFVFFLVSGAAALAFWIAVRFPRWGPSGLAPAFLHVAAALGVSLALAPAMALVIGKGLTFVAVFAIALPGFSYMFLAGIWLLRVAHGAVTR
jgi:hypothetical protein